MRDQLTQPIYIRYAALLRWLRPAAVELLDGAREAFVGMAALDGARSPAAVCDFVVATGAELIAYADLKRHQYISVCDMYVHRMQQRHGWAVAYEVAGVAVRPAPACHFRRAFRAADHGDGENARENVRWELGDRVRHDDAALGVSTQHVHLVRTCRCHSGDVGDYILLALSGGGDEC